MHCLRYHFVLLLLYLVEEAPQYFVTSSCMFLDEKTLLEMWLHPGLNLTIFQGTGRAQGIFSLVIILVIITT